MKIDITVKSMLVGVEVHEVSSFLDNLTFPTASIPLWDAQGGFNHYQGTGANAL
jgi:hypothetical protein